MFTGSVIQEKYDYLVENIDSKRLLDILFANDVITSSQLEDLRTLKMDNANRKLMNILCEIPITSFKWVLQALKKTNQLDIYSTLAEPGR